MLRISEYEPRIMWQEFQAISDIPRCTGAEDAVLSYIEQQAQDRGFSIRRDATGNMVVVLPATAGYESLPGIIIQGHVDMVCEKNMSTNHNFRHDPIRLKVDGQWLRAEGTTLGADNGIAVAMMLALMKGGYSHGPLELLFTIDEEGGLIGALKLDSTILSYRRMINLDSEEEGIFYISCAGGMETVGSLSLDWERSTSELKTIRISITGLAGGHSGTEIHRQCGNSLVLASRLLYSFPPEHVRLCNIFGGDRHNAIPREAVLEFFVDEGSVPSVKSILRHYEQNLRREFAKTEPNLTIHLDYGCSISADKMLTVDCQKRLAQMLMAIPNGVLSMSRIIDGMVSTSTNLAALYIQDGSLRILSSQRSDIKSLLDDAGQRVIVPIILAGGIAQSVRDYPSWEANPDSALLKSAQNLWNQEMENEAVVTSIHAGLECGVIGSKFDDDIDMISFGPNIQGAHTPEEKVDIASCGRVFDFLLKLITTSS